MWPLIRPKDSVSLRLIDGYQLKTGDLLAFWKDGDIVVHRFIGKKREKGVGWLCQKGDNLSGWSWIPEDEVLGCVESIRGRGRTVDLTARPWTWMNRVVGISWLLWISSVEKVRLLKACTLVGRLLPIPGRLVGSMGRTLNSAYGYIIIKTIGGIKT